MNLQELWAKVGNTSSDDWNKMEFALGSGHHSLAVFLDDVDVSIAYGRVVVEDFSEPWVTNFASPSANSIVVDLRYRGQVVDSTVFVSVDDGRYLLPMPKPEGGAFFVSNSQLPFAALMFDLNPPG